MSISFDLDIEWAYFLFVLAVTFIGAVVEWRRGGDLAVRVSVLEQTTVKAEDWSDMSARQTVIEKLTAKLLDEWSGEDEGEETDA